MVRFMELSTGSAGRTIDLTTTFHGLQETHQTWYKVVAPAPGPDQGLPLIVLHGGPGTAHDYMLSLADLAATGRPVIFYDQVGCGNSTRLPERGADFWTVPLFVAELQNLIDQLGLAETGFHVLGNSSQRHVCRLDPMPPDVARTFALLEEDSTVYRSTAWARSATRP
jgi:hypothetical protein